MLVVADLLYDMPYSGSFSIIATAIERNTVSYIIISSTSAKEGCHR